MQVIEFIFFIFKYIYFLFCLVIPIIGMIPMYIHYALYGYYVIIPLIMVILYYYIKFKDSTVRQSAMLFLLFGFFAELMNLKLGNIGGGLKNIGTGIYLLGTISLFTIIESYFLLIFVANVNDCNKKLKAKK